MQKPIAALLALALTNCALISHGTHQTITVTSDPPGAQAALNCDGKPAGTAETPGTITFKRRHDVCNVTFTREGSESKIVALDVSPSRAFWLNFGVVAVTGAATAYEQRDNNLGGILVIPVTLAVAGVTLLVDKLSGAYFEWTPHSVLATLPTRGVTSETRPETSSAP